ncbi:MULTISPECIES: CotD family spore coat protein [Bacillaceae]|uniref:CotD family spore coat protein n=1 Tax=Bacillaceae TaxID=186817 RepID=UPI00159BC9E2|nr:MULTISPECIES: CotD family spore coat protein [Bacillaceae]UGB31158.1 spore coat protein [Metabacillus sp. B2-18]
MFRGPAKKVVYPTRVNVRDVFYPQTIQHIKPVETIVRHNYINRHQSLYPHTVRNVATVRNVTLPPRSWFAGNSPGRGFTGPRRGFF